MLSERENTYDFDHWRRLPGQTGVRQAVERNGCYSFRWKNHLPDLLAASDMITHFHEVIRRLWLEKREISAVIEEVLAKNPDITIVMDEIGYGVVPMSAEDREYRELVGHTGQLLARQAEAVYRVVCGIRTRIK